MRADRLARLQGAVDRQAGEQVLVSPYAGGGYVAGAPDPARPPQTITGTVTEVPKTLHAVGHATNTGHNADLRTATHTVMFTASALPYALQRGDQVTLLGRGDVVLAVNSADPFGTGRTLLRLEPLPAAQ